MKEKILHPSESEPVSAEQVLQLFSDMRRTIEDAVLKAAKQNHFRPEDTKKALDLLNGKVDVFSRGLVAGGDLDTFYREADHWLGMAEAIAHGPDITTTGKVISKSLDALQGNMIVNQLLSEEAIEELQTGWSDDETSFE